MRRRLAAGALAAGTHGLVCGGQLGPAGEGSAANAVASVVSGSSGIDALGVVDVALGVGLSLLATDKASGLGAAGATEARHDKQRVGGAFLGLRVGHHGHGVVADEARGAEAEQTHTYTHAPHARRRERATQTNSRSALEKEEA